MFYTRPKIVPQNIDLIRLDGGGSYPSQFNGITSNGRDLDIYYRDGWLKAYVTFPNQPEVIDQPVYEELINQKIGPWYHGNILKEQVCDLLGLTLFGTTPSLTEDDRLAASDEHDWNFDWSGRTTYWDEDLHVTKAGGEHFVDALRAEFQDLRILDVQYTESRQHPGLTGSKRQFVQRNTISRCNHTAMLGINPNLERLDTLLQSYNSRFTDCRAAFDHVIEFGFDWDRRPDQEIRFFAGYNSKFFDAFGASAIVADRSAGLIRGEFATDDSRSAEYVARLYEVINSCFTRRAAFVDPDGTVLQLFDTDSLNSLDLVEWCRQSPNHYFSWTEKDFEGSKVVVGIRAV